MEQFLRHFWFFLWKKKRRNGICSYYSMKKCRFGIVPMKKNAEPAFFSYYFMKKCHFGILPMKKTPKWRFFILFYEKCRFGSFFHRDNWKFCRNGNFSYYFMKKCHFGIFLWKKNAETAFFILFYEKCRFGSFFHRDNWKFCRNGNFPMKKNRRTSGSILILYSVLGSDRIGLLKKPEPNRIFGSVLLNFDPKFSVRFRFGSGSVPVLIRTVRSFTYVIIRFFF